MSKLTEYTLEVYKSDRRTKDGVKLIQKMDCAPSTCDYITTLVHDIKKKGFIVKLHETYVTQRDFLSGREFRERYDTPYFCSPRSESYWST